MDIYCVRCLEPWDIGELHYRAEEVAGTFATVRDDFYSRGCEALGEVKCERVETLDEDGKLSTGAAMSALIDLLGDDIDGIASMMDDYNAGY